MITNFSSYNESLRDKMAPRSEEEIIKALDKTSLKNKLDKLIGWGKYDAAKDVIKSQLSTEKSKNNSTPNYGANSNNKACKSTRI